MNGFPLNGLALNSGGSLASIVYIPAATATVELALNERIAVSLSGGLDMSISPSGDIYRVSNLGTGTVEAGFLVEGSLTRSQQIYFDYSETGMSIDPSGSIATVILGPYGLSESGFEVTGNLVLKGLLSGVLDSATDVIGTLTRIRPLGSGILEKSFTVSGLLGATQYLSGNAGVSLVPTGTLTRNTINAFGYSTFGFSVVPSGSLQLSGGLNGTASVSLVPSGDLSKGVRVNLPSGSVSNTFALTGNVSSKIHLSGESTIQMDMLGGITTTKYLGGISYIQTTLAGSIANNAQNTDLAAVTMTRRRTNREMTR